ncbi:MAG TPA: glycosyltransferase [Planctomycetaceae bacterium]|nr:glycosyltransferase [Planctomycetaceae bacterium]
MSTNQPQQVITRPNTDQAIPQAAYHWPKKVNVLGMGVSCVDYQSAVSSIVFAAKQGLSGLVSCHSVHAVVTLTSTAQLQDMINQFDLITPDGQPVRWAMNWLHRAKLKERVYGPELMLRLCAQAQQDAMPVYLYGGNEIVSEKLCAALQDKFPGLIIAGAEAPPFRPLTLEEDLQVAKRINASGAKLIFIGLGCPKQDQFAYRQRDRIQGIQICVGAAFDFHAGVKAMAPYWMQKRGLEWLFRLYQEPGRLWKRYVTTNSVFVLKVTSQALKGQVGRRASSSS